MAVAGDSDRIIDGACANDHTSKFNSLIGRTINSSLVLTKINLQSMHVYIKRGIVFSWLAAVDTWITAETVVKT